MSFDVPLCSWATDPDSEDEDSWKEAEKDADRTARIGQAGNCMHTQCIGLVILHALSNGNMPVKALDQAGMRGQIVPLHQLHPNHQTGNAVDPMPSVPTHQLLHDSHEHGLDLITALDEPHVGHSQGAAAGTSASKPSTQPHDEKPVTVTGCPGSPAGLSPCLGTMGLMIAQRSRAPYKKP